MGYGGTTCLRLIEALKILKDMNQRHGPARRYILVTGLNPLHLKTFLAAELSLLSTDSTIEVLDSLYGDLVGNLDRLAKADAEIGIVLIEWPDFDPRLG